MICIYEYVTWIYEKVPKSALFGGIGNTQVIDHEIFNSHS